jgi:hypothetical protein
VVEVVDLFTVLLNEIVELEFVAHEPLILFINRLDRRLTLISMNASERLTSSL